MGCEFTPPIDRFNAGDASELRVGVQCSEGFQDGASKVHQQGYTWNRRNLNAHPRAGPSREFEGPAGGTNLNLKADTLADILQTPLTRSQPKDQFPLAHRDEKNGIYKNEAKVPRPHWQAVPYHTRRPTACVNAATAASAG